MSAPPTLSAQRRESLLSCREEFTCYSAAIATWLAVDQEDWARSVNPGLWLTITEPGDGVFGFAYFPPQLRAELGLQRTGADQVGAAIEGVRQEIARSGRVIVAGDGFHLPWHVAAGRLHLPHWYVLLAGAEGLEVMDPFACRNALGVQEATRLPVAPEALGGLLHALPGDDPIHVLRERLAFGDETEPCALPHQWFVRGVAADWRRPEGANGPDALRRLAEHFRTHGQDPRAYAQADDIWSIARHRAFLHRWANVRALQDGDDALADWVASQATPLIKRWGHIAPLLMQAALALGAGRQASASVPDTLEHLATLEQSASDALKQNSFSI
ncbi:MAG: hypothetical protein M3Z06_08880 [Actinomycetota bacterium]|nr:hypothetical protein [Actinomycetota bacterium]